MNSQKEQLRLKIKKLKYKIDKEEKILHQYNLLLNRLKRFNQQKLSIGKILKKINFLLEVKGMRLIDWVRACPYDEEIKIDRMVDILEKMGIKLPRQERSLLTNFMGDELSEFMTVEDFKKIVQMQGLELTD